MWRLAMRTFLYVDGFNLYYGALKGTPWKWLDLPALFAKVLQPHHDILRVKYFTARVSSTLADLSKPQRQDVYLRALQHYRPEVEVYFGHFLSDRVRMPLAHPVGNQRTAEVIKIEEKGSDVNLAVHLLNDCWLNAYDCAVVVSNDSDLAEAMRLVRGRHPKLIGLMIPGSGRSSVRLRANSDFTRRIRESALRSSQLPDPIPGTNIRKPAQWWSENPHVRVVAGHVMSGVGGDIRRSFIGRGAGDERCTEAEIERLLRDAADERHDGGTVDLDPERCFDDASLRWYRKHFEDRNPGHDESLSHLEFLHHWGFVIETGDRLRPTRAAVLLFGTEPAFHQLLPRPVVDWQWSRGNWSEELAEERWADRLVIETNLVKTWRALIGRYLQRAEKPFSIDPGTLQRDDRPPDYIAFREGVINLLIHQDYADHTRKPVIRSFDDRVIMWNPGDAFAGARELLDPVEKEVRNPRIVAAFRRIGLSEQAGTGIRAIFGNWQRLGRVPPVIDNDRARKAFQLTLSNEELLSEEQLRFQASLGIHLDEAGARAFAFVCREGRLSLRGVRAVAGLSGAAARSVLERLAAQGLISPLESAETPAFAVAEHLKERLGRDADRPGGPTDAGSPDLVTDQPRSDLGHLVSDQVPWAPADLSTAQGGTSPAGLSSAQPPNLSTAQAEPLTKLSATHRKIMGFCDTPRRLTEIMDALGAANRGYFKKHHLDPLLANGMLRMTRPDQPNHPEQAYVLTEVGAALMGRHVNAEAATGGEASTDDG